MSLIINLNGKYGDNGLSIPIKPVISVTEQKPTSLTVVLSNYDEAQNFEFQVDDNIQFESPITLTQENNIAVFENLGEGQFFVRGRGLSPSTQYSNVIDVFLEATQLRSLTISAQAEDSQVSISHNLLADEPNIETVNVLRRTASTQFAVIDNFSGTTSNYVDVTVNNDTEYFYRLDLVPSSFDFLSSQSNVVNATPVATIPQLSPPTNLNVVWDNETEGTGTFSWNNVTNATSYDVYLDDVFVENINTNSRLFTGLTKGTVYSFGVEAKADGYTNSENVFINRSPLDLTVTQIIPENYGAEAYYKPLDGRYAEGLQFPLINYEPLTEEEFNLLNTGLTYSNYPNGVTKISPVDNNGNAVNGVFQSEDVGKKFVGLRANRNGDSTIYIDEYAPFTISSRYANVIYQNGNICLVDFEFNGNAQSGQPSQSLLKGKGRIFYDNSTALNNWVNAVILQSSTENVVGAGESYSRNGYVLKVYEAPEFIPPSIISSNNNITLTTKSGAANVVLGDRMRIKFGIEDYYQFQPIEGAKKYNQSQNIFKFSGYTGKFVSHGVQWIPPAYSFLASQSFLRIMTSGSFGENGASVIIHGENFAEYDELQAGYGVNQDEQYQIQSSNISSCGTYTGDGSVVTHDVDKFVFDAHINCHYSGAFAGGQRGGSTRGALFEIYKDFVLDFEPQEKYAPFTMLSQAKFTTNYSGLAGGGGDTDYLPPHAIEITSDNGTFFEVLTMGGGYRNLIFHIDRFVFLGNYTRFNQINGYYNYYYKNTSTPITTDRDGSYTRNPKKTMVDWMIMRSKENDGVTPKLLRLSKEYNMRESLNNDMLFQKVIPSLGIPMNNSVKTHINWSLVFQKYKDQLSNDDLNYISEVESRPQALQLGDKYRLCAWVEVSNTIGFNIGDTITIKDSSNNVLATANLRYVDDYLYTKRLILGECTANISTASTVENASTSTNVTNTSDFDPTLIYTISRLQTGGWPVSNLFSRISLDNKTSFTNGVVIQGVTSGAIGTVVTEKLWETDESTNSIKVQVTNNTKFLVGETINITSGGSGSAVIQNNSKCNNNSGEVYLYSLSTDMVYGAAISTGSWEAGYYYWYGITDIDMPNRVNGNDNNDPLMYVEVVESNAEVLLDGESRPFRVTYRSLGKLLNSYTFNNFNRKLDSTGYLNGTDINNLQSFDSANWLSEGEAAGHLFYSTGERTYYWLNGNANLGYARVNNTSDSSNSFERFSKGWWIKDVINPPSGQWMSPELGSTRTQFETQYNYHLQNTSYDPTVNGYAANEEIGYDNAGNKLFPPKICFYGSNYLDNNGGMNNTSGQNIIRSQNSQDAPELPKTIKDILTALGESTTID